jgi:F-type H+-transporting ATPase subunit b
MTAHPAESLSLLDTLLKSNVFNLALVLALLAFVFNKFKLGQAVTRQRDTIQADLAAAQAQREAAEALLDTAQQRLNALESEIETLMSHAQQSAEALQAQIIANAQQEAQRLLEAAHQRGLLEEKASAAQVKADFIRQAVAEVRSQLAAQNGSSAAHQASFSNLLNDLSALPLASTVN